LDYFGHDWECTRGYRREGDRCVRLQVPPHAFLDFSGHAWACERGYRQAGDRCIPVQVPPYAFLNYFGHDWECTRGYRREGDRCVSVQPGQASLARTGEAATGAAFPRDELAQLATDVYTNREALHDWQTIAHLQRQLHQAGYDPGPIDGLLGPRTLEVLRQFLADRGLLPEATSRATTSSAPES
jgi:hypothetical protein